MPTKKSPLAQVKEQFGSKEKLVDALVALPQKVLDRAHEDEDKDAFRTRLLASANNKLLRLHRLGQLIQEKWGSKEQLVEALLSLQNRAKDGDYRTKLATISITRLYDQWTSLARRAKRQAAQKSAAPASA